MMVYQFLYLNNNKTETLLLQTEIKYNSNIKAEVEVLNGCGESGIANLYTNFLRQEGFDVIDIKNASNFDYLNTTILVHKMEKIEIIKELAKILGIKIENIKESKNGMWDFSIIIGADYKKLESFEKIKKYYEPF